MAMQECFHVLRLFIYSFIYPFMLFVAGKDARLYVFRLRALKRGLEEKQLVRGKCDSRENKLEKTKGTAPETQCDVKLLPGRLYSTAKRCSSVRIVANVSFCFSVLKKFVLFRYSV